MRETGFYPLEMTFKDPLKKKHTVVKWGEGFEKRTSICLHWRRAHEVQ